MSLRLSAADGVCPAKSAKVKTHAMKIFHRYHFSSALKRMSVVAGYQPAGTTENEIIASIKGAPETLQGMVSLVYVQSD